MSIKTRIEERERKEKRLRISAIVGGSLILVLLLVLIGIAIWCNGEKPGPQVPQGSKKDELVCSKLSTYSGEYVEDGSNVPVENVASILVTNKSDKFLDLATIEYVIDGKAATFVVTGLPAGKSAWVLEDNKLTITGPGNYKEVDITPSYKEGVVSKTDKITLIAEGNMLTAINNTDEKLEGVFVYYKTKHTDGNYLGGITYMVTYGDIEPGGKVTKLAGHYDSKTTEVVRIGWKEN